jgi:hypothetical protein
MIRTIYVSTEKIGPADDDYRPLCMDYEAHHGQGYCKGRVTHRVTMRVLYCCQDETCAGGVYVTMDLCQAHARRYGHIKDEVQGAA